MGKKGGLGRAGTFLGFAAVTAGAVVASTLASGRAVTPWYRALRKPTLQPPPQAFGPVWTVLYGLIAYSGYRVYRQPPSAERSHALMLWGTQLALNAAWSPLFFGKHQGRAALADIVAMTGTTGAYVASASQVDRRAAAAVAPYLAWISFATYLNEEIVRKNPRSLVG